jgi:cytochrome c oxidase subunit 2
LPIELSRETKMVNVFFYKTQYNGDAPRPLQISFQDPATAYMEGVLAFNAHLLTLIIGIVLIVGWMMVSILTTHLEVDSSEVKGFYHSSVIEIVWTSVPGLLLFSLAYPSYNLLYSLAEEHDTTINIKIFGHQWYWRYEITDLERCDSCEIIKFASYALVDEFMCLDKSGIKRNLEVDRRLILPLRNMVKLLITGSDVLHSWAIPSFGIKVDACPGRINTAYLYVKRQGIFFGQCSEICGVNHGFMPIVALVVPLHSFRVMLVLKIDNITNIF